MSTCTKEETLDRCYCRVQNKEINLNDIVEIIIALNTKIVRLRNEVSTLKYINVNQKKKLIKKPEVAAGRLSSRGFEKKLDTINHGKIYNKIIKNEKNETDFSHNKKLHDGSDSPPKIRKKKISKGIQCGSTMEHKRKRISLNCFKIERNIKEHDSLKQHKRRKTSKNNFHVTFDTPMENNSEEKEILSPFQKITENQIGGNLKKFRGCRMGGGAEFCKNHLIPNFNNKVPRMNLYKNAKFDAKNVKRRLDACIVELNGIIEDISLIFPETDIAEDLKK
ncbi:uncharacterized protein LOC123988347 [Osmia bicornis bicornis]|uniref:uncharacterized protein LOC123988347 n=1 Tax=Osmia bicornis bicornis TaxID=1437191 RepID=UPI001EAF4904|nr:uncharacterized protein LOC123988347 [Osmia bicornis bicornis]